MTDLGLLRNAVESGDQEEAVRLTQEAIAAETPPQSILSTMTEAMDAVGEKFQDGECFIPEMLLASRAMSNSMVLLEPVLVESGSDEQIRHVGLIGCRRRVAFPGHGIEFRFAVSAARPEAVVPDIEWLQRPAQARLDESTGTLQQR